MLAATLIASVLAAAAVVLLLGLTPEQVTDDILKIVSPKQSLRDKARIAQGRKKSRRISMELNHLKDSMLATGKGAQFTAVCALSLVLLVVGVLASLLLGNPLLAPVLGAALCLLPFAYAKNTVKFYDKHISDEMETALSVISTSYIRNDDIVAAIKENITYLKPPVRELFLAFVGDATAVTSDVKAAILNLQSKIDNDIFREWCDVLLQCQDDRTMKDTLLPVVNKLTDVRIVNNELQVMLSSVRSEYYTMVALVIGNIPLLYVLNKDWFGTLMYTLPGKTAVALCGLIILITARLMIKYTRPIKYKR